MNGTSQSRLTRPTPCAREAAIAKAKTAEERQKAKEENKVYRITAIFTGNEADIVRAVLGEKPAEWILNQAKNLLNAKE